MKVLYEAFVRNLLCQPLVKGFLRNLFVQNLYWFRNIPFFLECSILFRYELVKKSVSPQNSEFCLASILQLLFTSAFHLITTTQVTFKIKYDMLLSFV